MTRIHLISTLVTGGTCHRCGAVVLAAMVEGFRTRVDPVALSPAEILACVITGRALYRLTRGGSELVPLAPPQRAAIMRIRGPTMPQHICGQFFTRHESAAEALAMDQSTHEGIPF